MTVAELIENLQKFNPDNEVCFNFYNDEYDDYFRYEIYDVKESEYNKSDLSEDSNFIKVKYIELEFVDC